jgi:DsbC/DsbD-like thiol-disulfide interchange protein
MHRTLRTLSLLLGLIAGPVTATTQDDVLSAALLPGWQTESGTRMAGLELSLAPGWKTYWRSPGDAGIPPSFDWFHTDGMQSIGYHDRVILPLEVTAIDPGQPMRLAVEVQLGICDKICLPASLSLASELGAAGGADDGIAAALAQRAATAGEAGVSGVSCTIDPIADGLRLTARIGLADTGHDEVVAFETADPAVWVAEAVTRREGGELVTMTELVPPNGAPFALERSAVTMTILYAGAAIEVRGCPAP